jgi:single-strand DNA-binding protein
MNIIFLTGHVGQDPQKKSFENNRTVITFSLATNKRYKGKDGEMHETPTQWHNVQAWGYLADVPVEKGSLVHVVGEVQYREYTDKDGIKRWTTDVVATELHIIQRVKKVQSAPMPNISDDPFAKNNPSTTDNAPLPTAIPGAAPTGDGDDLPF